MKQIATLSLIVLFLSCKNESKNETNDISIDSVSNNKKIQTDSSQNNTLIVRKDSNIVLGELDSLIFSVKLENRVKYFVNLLGTPDSTISDNNDPSCPFGQLSFWNKTKNNLKVIVLGDDYSGKTNFKATTRYVIFQSLRDKDSLFVFKQVYFKMTLDSFKKTLKVGFDKSKVDGGIEEFDKKSAGTVLLSTGIDFVKGYFLKDGDYFYYFLFNKDLKLEFVIKSTFDERQAC